MTSSSPCCGEQAVKAELEVLEVLVREVQPAAEAAEDEVRDAVEGALARDGQDDLVHGAHRSCGGQRSMIPDADDGVVLVEDGRLARGDAVCRLVELEPEAVTLGLDGRPGRPASGSGASPRRVDRAEERSRWRGRPTGRAQPRPPDDDAVRRGLGPQNVERLAGGDAEPAPLARE